MKERNDSYDEIDESLEDNSVVDFNDFTPEKFKEAANALKTDTRRFHPMDLASNDDEEEKDQVESSSFDFNGPDDSMDDSLDDSYMRVGYIQIDKGEATAKDLFYQAQLNHFKNSQKAKIAKAAKDYNKVAVQYQSENVYDFRLDYREEEDEPDEDGPENEIMTEHGLKEKPEPISERISLEETAGIAKKLFDQIYDKNSVRLFRESKKDIFDYIYFKGRNGGYRSLRDHFKACEIDEKLKKVPDKKPYYYAEATRLLLDPDNDFRFYNKKEIDASEIVTSRCTFSDDPEFKFTAVKGSPKREVSLPALDDWGRPYMARVDRSFIIDKANDLVSIISIMRQDVSICRRKLQDTLSAKVPEDFFRVMTSLRNLQESLGDGETSMEKISDSMRSLKNSLAAYEGNHREFIFSHGSQATADRYNIIAGMMDTVDSNLKLFNMALVDYAETKVMIRKQDKPEVIVRKMSDKVIKLKDLHTELEGNVPAVTASFGDKVLREKRDDLYRQLVELGGSEELVDNHLTAEKLATFPYADDPAKGAANVLLINKYQKRIEDELFRRSRADENINKESNYKIPERILVNYQEVGTHLNKEAYNKELNALAKNGYFHRILNKTMVNGRLNPQAFMPAWQNIEKESAQLKERCRNIEGLCAKKYKHPYLARANKLIAKVLQNPKNTVLLNTLANQSEKGREEAIVDVALYLIKIHPIPDRLQEPKTAQDLKAMKDHLNRYKDSESLDRSIALRLHSYFSDEERISRYEYPPNSDQVVREYNDLKPKAVEKKAKKLKKPLDTSIVDLNDEISTTVKKPVKSVKPVKKLGK